MRRMNDAARAHHATAPASRGSASTAFAESLEAVALSEDSGGAEMASMAITRRAELFAPRRAAPSTR